MYCSFCASTILGNWENSKSKKLHCNMGLLHPGAVSVSIFLWRWVNQHCFAIEERMCAWSQDSFIHLGSKEVLFVHELCLLIKLVEKSPCERTENWWSFFFFFLPPFLCNIMYTFKLRSPTEGKESRCEELQLCSSLRDERLVYTVCQLLVVELMA